MSKKSALDLAIEEMDAKRTVARMKFLAEDAAMATAIEAMRGQTVRRVRKPRAVEKAERPSLASA